jgi:hypothetical protein
MEQFKKALKFTITLLLIGVIIETIHYQNTFPKVYKSLNEAIHYSYLSLKHGIAFFIVFFIPTFCINYIINKL